MLLLEKFKESCISIAPVMGLVLFLHASIVPFPDMLPRFIVGGILLTIGLTIFLVGTEIGVVPMGQKTGAVLTGRRSLPLMLAVGFCVGFFATVAEPDVQVLAVQVAGVAPSIEPTRLVFMIALGVGLFVAIAMWRSAMRFSLRTVLAICYSLIFICANFIDPAFFAIAFDASGATTGPMTVPFIMALGVGVASVYSNHRNAGDQSFGFIALASVGPIMAVLVLGAMQASSAPEATSALLSVVAEPSVPPEPLTLIENFLSFVPHVALEVATALGPLAVMFAVFQVALIKMPPIRVLRTCVGLFYTFVGLVFFFTGVKGGFMPAGELLGGALAQVSPLLLVMCGLFLGGVVVCAEPAVWVLTDQVENASGRHIKRRVMLASLAIGVALAVALAMVRVVFGWPLWMFIGPGYILAFFLSYFCPPMFTAIAFDSGGVASGPLASTFILAFTLGASASLGGNPMTDAFGVIALIATAPLITIQALGIIYARKMKAAADVSHAKESS